MCTVSWRLEPDRESYELLFNRDELDTRGPEAAPRVATGDDGVRYIAPRDSDGGGTWISVNEIGITLCLLNDYATSWRPRDASPARSRGEIVRACADVASFEHLLVRLSSLPLLHVRPFHLLVFAPGKPVQRLHWTGAELMHRSMEGCLPLWSSSSFATESVVAARVCTYLLSIPNPMHPSVADLGRFHRQHDPNAAAHSVLMRRGDARTRSITRIAVSPAGATCSYARVVWNSSRAGVPNEQRLHLHLQTRDREYSELARVPTNVSAS